MSIFSKWLVGGSVSYGKFTQSCPSEKKLRTNNPQDWEQWLWGSTAKFSIDTQLWCFCSKTCLHLKRYMDEDDFALCSIGPIRQIEYTTGMVQKKYYFSLLKWYWMSKYHPAVQDTWRLAAKNYNMAKNPIPSEFTGAHYVSKHPCSPFYRLLNFIQQSYLWAFLSSSYTAYRFEYLGLTKRWLP